MAKLTGFKLFHNHVSIQFVQSIFEFGTKTFWRLTGKYRLEMIEEAAKDGIDTIFTFVYSKGEDDRFVRDVLKSVRPNRGTVCFVRLYCDRKELTRRVKLSQRRRMGKIGSEKMLSDLFRRYNLNLEIPFHRSLSIDTTNRTPKSVGKIDHASLQAIVAAQSDMRSLGQAVEGSLARLSVLAIAVWRSLVSEYRWCLRRS